MDYSQNDNKDSDDSIQLKLSPNHFERISKTDGSSTIKSEKSATDKPDETQNGSRADSNQLVNDSKGDKTLIVNKDEGDKEILAKTPLATDNENHKKIKDSDHLLQDDTKDLDKSINPKNVYADKSTDSAKDAKRKRRTSSDHQSDSAAGSTVKRAKIKNANDNYCWRCHKESVDARCSACPRSWHRKCMGGAPPTSINETWICGECATILRAENAETRSEIVAHLSIDHLCMLLKYIVECMRSCNGSEPFWKAVDLVEVPTYLDYVVRPMDLSLLESNVRSKLYGSTDAFMADAKWIQHNCIVFNTCGGVYSDRTNLTNAAKLIIKTAKQEVAEIEACPDCYVRGRNLPRPHPSWFIEACRQPHPLLWAKLKGFPFWPAKAMPRVNGQGHVDVRFFGQHDRAWVPPKDLYLYSRDPPTPLPRKRKLEMAECIKEINRHCRKLEIAFGPFQFAPPKIPYNPQDPMQIKLMLPDYDPMRPNENVPSPALVARRKSPIRKRITPVKRKLLESDVPINDTNVESTNISAAEAASRDSSEKINETIAEVAADAVKPKKRAKKSVSSSETRSTLQDNTSTLQDKTMVSMPDSSTASVNDSTDKVNTISNGTPESKSSPIRKNSNQTKAKSEKSVITLEKSLAALLRNVNPKGRLSHPRNSNAKGPVLHSTPNNSAKIESKTNTIKVYKPKARMLDKVNAEKALKSTIDKEQNKSLENDVSKPVEAQVMNGLISSVNVPTTTSGSSASSIATGTVSLLNAKQQQQQHDSNKIVLTNSILKTPPAKKLHTRILLVNNGSVESKLLNTQSDDSKSRTEQSMSINVKEEPQTPTSVQKKQSRAKKTFPNKPPRLPQLLPKLPKPSTNTLDTMVYIPARGTENGLDYQLPPPEAGPLSAQLHRGASELAKRMAQLMEEALKEAAESSINEYGNSVDSHKATIHSLRLQIERMRWQHQQQLAELKHNTDRTLREMQASFEAERLRAIEDIRKEAEDERIRSIEETKSKQWCAQCGREALFYCCWNTAYCDHVCQQAHWQSHQRKCAQKPSFNSIVSGQSGDTSNQQQVMPTLVLSAQQANTNVRGA